MFEWTSSLLERQTPARQLVLGIVIGISLSLTSATLVQDYRARRRKEQVPEFSERPIELRSDEILDGVAGLVGECVVEFEKGVG